MVLGCWAGSTYSAGQGNYLQRFRRCPAKAVDDPPDLLSVITACPEWMGSNWWEGLRGRPKTAGIAVILLASKADITERFAPMNWVMILSRNFLPKRSHPAHQSD